MGKRLDKREEKEEEEEEEENNANRKKYEMNQTEHERKSYFF